MTRFKNGPKTSHIMDIVHISTYTFLRITAIKAGGFTQVVEHLSKNYCYNKNQKQVSLTRPDFLM
jgi:hypothetical protein